MSPANLSEPGWAVRQGQAVWQARPGAPEIAGDILLATNAARRTFVQFTKTPFPFVIAQSTTNTWQIEAPVKNRVYVGHGSPPGRILWLQLPRAVAGAPLPRNWSWRPSENRWRLENRSTGESLDGYFNQ